MAGTTGTEAAVERLPGCDLCHPSKPAKAAYDGKTKRGPWAFMCEPCFVVNGIGLGTGKGQRLIQKRGAR